MDDLRQNRAQAEAEARQVQADKLAAERHLDDLKTALEHENAESTGSSSAHAIPHPRLTRPHVSVRTHTQRKSWWRRRSSRSRRWPA